MFSFTRITSTHCCLPSFSYYYAQISHSAAQLLGSPHLVESIHAAIVTAFMSTSTLSFETDALKQPQQQQQGAAQQGRAASTPGRFQPTPPMQMPPGAQFQSFPMQLQPPPPPQYMQQQQMMMHPNNQQLLLLHQQHQQLLQQQQQQQ